MIRSKLKRRQFLAASAAAASVPLILPRGALAAEGKKGANDRVQVGFIGFGGRAKSLLSELGPLRDKGEAEVVAVCDVDETRLANASKLIGSQAAVYRDYRYILQR